MVIHTLVVVRRRRVRVAWLGDVWLPGLEGADVRRYWLSELGVAGWVFPPVKVLLPAHETIRIFFVLFTNARMTCQELLQRRVVLDKLLVVHQRWILAQLFRDLRMAVHEAVHVHQFLMCHIAVTTLVFPPVEPLLLAHDTVRILADLFSDLRGLLQILLQRRMRFDK